jgi:hypothetical protein
MPESFFDSAQLGHPGTQQLLRRHGSTNHHIRGLPTSLNESHFAFRESSTSVAADSPSA